MNNYANWARALLCTLLFSLLVLCDPVKDISPVSSSQDNKATVSSPSTTGNAASEADGATPPVSRVPGNDVLSPRWSMIDPNTNLAILAFTSTNSINQAVTMLNDVSGALSYTNFGRVPFYQTVVVPANDKTVMASRLATTLTAIPEPTTLLLLGTGLAAISIGMRKKR